MKRPTRTTAPKKGAQSTRRPPPKRVAQRTKPELPYEVYADGEDAPRKYYFRRKGSDADFQELHESTLRLLLKQAGFAATAPGETITPLEKELLKIRMDRVEITFPRFINVSRRLVAGRYGPRRLGGPDMLLIAAKEPNVPQS